MLMCSCVSKKVSKSAKVSEQISGKLDYVMESLKVDTFCLRAVDKSREYKFIKQTITIKEYDKDTGNLTQETKAETEFAQGVQTDTEEESLGKATESVADSVGKEENVITESETEENSVNWDGLGMFWERFGKYLGIGISCIIAMILVYLCRKFRVN